jgi:phosphatidylglycerol:prolipoprotein diacylglycerol transferase
LQRYLHFFNYDIPTYGLCIMIAIMLSGFLIVRKSKKAGVGFEDVLIVMAVAVAAAMFGGGLLYIIVSYSPMQIVNYIKSGDFSFLMSGGLVFYGGAIGGILGALISAKIMKIEINALERCIVPYIPLGHAVGRIGCLLAGCCYGFKYEGIFAVENHYAIEEGTFFPVQAVESVMNLIIMVIMLLYAAKVRSNYSVLSLYLCMYGTVRFFLEFLRGDQIRGIALGLSTSQWVSITIILLCLLFKIHTSKKHIYFKPR